MTEFIHKFSTMKIRILLACMLGAIIAGAAFSLHVANQEQPAVSLTLNHLEAMAGLSTLEWSLEKQQPESYTADCPVYQLVVNPDGSMHMKQVGTQTGTGIFCHEDGESDCTPHPACMHI